MTLIGKNIEGYHITDFIDSGGFGSVYKAEKKGIPYAIKMFREDYVLKEYRENGENNRIKREIEIMKSVIHPNLISYVDDFQNIVAGVPSYFLVMEFAEGQTLRNLMNHGKVPIDQANSIFSNLMHGIEALHNIRGYGEDSGIIHRDLKPENIIVNGTSLKILDYGISKVIDYTTITNSGDVMGSPVYMSPEQIKDSKNIDKRSDLYALGVILYEVLTGNLPYEFNSLPELYDRILNSRPLPPRRWDPLIDNQLENMILKLLEKLPYKRYHTILDLRNDFENRPLAKTDKKYDNSLRLFIRLYNEKSAIEKFSSEYDNEISVIFPINYTKLRQTKNILPMLDTGNFKKIIDPATVRLAYSAQKNVKGLQELPYAPPKFTVITPSYLSSDEKKQEYVKQVIDEQAKFNPEILLTPFHYVHNTNVSPTQRRNPVADWFDLDIKLTKESINYKNSIDEYSKMQLFTGICINGNSLLDQSYREDFLNIFSAMACDGYLIYVDNISNHTDSPTLYHYIKTLSTLQAVTSKPVVAGRVNPIGLGLLCAGATGFSIGTSRFDSFYEGLYKEESETYNMYERYYVKELLSIIAIPRRNPVKLKAVLDIVGHCTCNYCREKEYIDVINASNNKLHFLEIMHQEIQNIRDISKEDRMGYFIDRIDTAQAHFVNMRGIYKPTEYTFLSTWKEVFTELQKEATYV